MLTIKPSELVRVMSLAALLAVAGVSGFAQQTTATPNPQQREATRPPGTATQNPNTPPGTQPVSTDCARREYSSRRQRRLPEFRMLLRLSQRRLYPQLRTEVTTPDVTHADNGYEPDLRNRRLPSFRQSNEGLCHRCRI